MGQIRNTSGALQANLESDILKFMSDLENAAKEKDTEKLLEKILAGFQQLDEDLKAEDK